MHPEYAHNPPQPSHHYLLATFQNVRTQEAKNKKRQPAKRWNEAKIERIVNKYTDDFISNVYDKLYKGVKANRTTPRDKWIEFIETNEILDSLEESVSMIEIGED